MCQLMTYWEHPTEAIKKLEDIEIDVCAAGSRRENNSDDWLMMM